MEHATLESQTPDSRPKDRPSWFGLLLLSLVIFEGVVIGWNQVGWFGAIIGPFAVFLGCLLFGVVGTVVFVTIFHFTEKIRSKPKPPSDGLGDF